MIAIPFGAGLSFRRGWTHGVLAVVVLPILLTAALLGWEGLQRRLRSRPAERESVRPGPLLLVSFAAVLSHPLLDWLNSYGVRLLMPFSERWFYGDSIFIVDLWLLAILGAGVLLSQRRNGPMGDHGIWPTRPARVALGLAAVYILANVALTVVLRREAIRYALSSGSASPAGLMAGPVPLNPLRRELIYDFGDRYRIGRAVWAGEPVIETDMRDLPTNLEHALVRENLARPVVRDYLAWSRFPFVLVEEEPEGAWLHFADARFRTAAGWSVLSVRVPVERGDR